MVEHFTLFGLEPAFELDLAALEAAYFKAQRLYHPDRFVGKPPAERMAAMQRSMDVNKAYDILKNPLTRAQYLLHLQGITVGTEADSIKPLPALLMEIMELREDGVTREKLTDMIARSQASISAHFAAQTWEAMAHETLRLGYLLKILNDTRN
jgi:molecular chaperone HscB